MTITPTHRTIIEAALYLTSAAILWRGRKVALRDPLTRGYLALATSHIAMSALIRFTGKAPTEKNDRLRQNILGTGLASLGALGLKRLLSERSWVKIDGRAILGTAVGSATLGTLSHFVMNRLEERSSATSDMSSSIEEMQEADQSNRNYQDAYEQYYSQDTREERGASNSSDEEVVFNAVDMSTPVVKRRKNPQPKTVMMNCLSQTVRIQRAFRGYLAKKHMPTTETTEPKSPTIEAVPESDLVAIDSSKDRIRSPMSIGPLILKTPTKISTILADEPPSDSGDMQEYWDGWRKDEEATLKGFRQQGMVNSEINNISELSTSVAKSPTIEPARESDLVVTDLDGNTGADEIHSAVEESPEETKGDPVDVPKTRASTPPAPQRVQVKNPAGRFQNSLRRK
jgi:hypothetical protein